MKACAKSARCCPLLTVTGFPLLLRSDRLPSPASRSPVRFPCQLRFRNWSTGVDFNKSSKNSWPFRRLLASKSTFLNGADVNSKNVCPRRSAFKDQLWVPTRRSRPLRPSPPTTSRMDYEPFKAPVHRLASRTFGATLSMFLPEGRRIPASSLYL